MQDRGFWIIEGVFSELECTALTDELATSSVGRSRAGARHLMSEPAVRRVASDGRLLAIARQALGENAVPYRATLFEKSKESNWLVVWHQDTALPLARRFDTEEWGPWSTKVGILYAHAPTWALERILALRLHLDASFRENGPLRVIPYSHRLGVLSDDEVFHTARQQPHEECYLRRGGVLAMRPLIIHSSQKALSNAPRRVLHLEYAVSLDLAPSVRLAIA
jgi:ectoine hydroxylase-related dioxygenase (phytanoyl-CoA dioxygenase family)